MTSEELEQVENMIRITNATAMLAQQREVLRGFVIVIANDEGSAHRQAAIAALARVEQLASETETSDD